jgi:hypothetical protein
MLGFQEAILAECEEPRKEFSQLDVGKKSNFANIAFAWCEMLLGRG